MKQIKYIKQYIIYYIILSILLKMNPIITNFNDNDHNTLGFTISDINISFVNSLRRIILSEIPTVVIITFPHSESECDIIENNSRFTNEIIKQRLSCIPIHISEDTINMTNYTDFYLEIKYRNDTGIVQYITSKDFSIVRKSDGVIMSDKFTQSVFPPDDVSNTFIDFLRMRPKVGDDIPSDNIHILAKFNISNALRDGMYNVVSKCSYGLTVDKEKQNAVLNELSSKWTASGLSEEEIEIEKTDWFLLDGKRVTLKDSFDFTIQTVGIYTNRELLTSACNIINGKLDDLNANIEQDNIEITPSISTLSNSYDIILKNEDYTIGKIIEFAFYSQYFENNIATFCGFQKKHPHDNYSIIRVAYSDPVEISTILLHLKECVVICKNVYSTLITLFKE